VTLFRARTLPPTPVEKRIEEPERRVAPRRDQSFVFLFPDIRQAMVRLLPGRMASSVSCHHLAHRPPPHTTQAGASWPMFSKPQRSKSTGSLRPNLGSDPHDIHHSPSLYAP